jgi:hypothetical protein
VEKLREAAELFATLSRNAGRELGYDEEGVAWADQYVEAVRPVETEDQLRVQTALVGAFLGEALLARHGGAWEEDDGEWSVVLEDGRRVHPFRATMAQLREEGAESILALYRFVGASSADADEEGDDAGGEPAAAPEPDVEPIHEAARRFAEVIQANGGPAEYGGEMMSFVDQFVDATRPIAPEMLDSYATLVGAVLGESVVQTYGGAWAATESGWAVRFEGGEILPFEAARRHLVEGPAESVLACFRALAGAAEDGEA